LASSVCERASEGEQRHHRSCTQEEEEEDEQTTLATTWADSTIVCTIPI